MKQTEITLDTPMEATAATVGLALFLILLGLTAIFAPLAVGVAVSMLILWIIVLGGLAHLIHAWDARNRSIFRWRLATGLVYLLGGAFLMMYPGYGAGYLTLFIAGMFCLEALLLIPTYVWLRAVPGAAWIAVDCLLTFLLAGLIAWLWPWHTAWLLGVLVGINILVSGVAWLALVYAIRSRA
ncbi:MAG TPA: DUF308 domain-containing protein [Gammaproteobacteria bacterium]|nr:DUF308 domain-containing protein [Gammaproteobacteria bacterium]